MNTKSYVRTLFVLICCLSVIGPAFGGGQTESASGAKEITLIETSGKDPGDIDPVSNWLYDLPANMFVSLVQYDYVNLNVEKNQFIKDYAACSSTLRYSSIACLVALFPLKVSRSFPFGRVSRPAL